MIRAVVHDCALVPTEKGTGMKHNYETEKKNQGKLVLELPDILASKLKIRKANVQDSAVYFCAVNSNTKQMKSQPNRFIIFHRELSPGSHSFCYDRDSCQVVENSVISACGKAG